MTHKINNIDYNLDQVYVVSEIDDTDTLFFMEFVNGHIVEIRNPDITALRNERLIIIGKMNKK